ncbi:MAG: SPFH/Band 7/PHB domain protein [Verrucomicrobia bacterium]|nr:SPFH/Band 7/PHB domain protein [Verrucomicrobiota bacterium]
MELTEQQTNTRPRECFTKDNAMIEVNAVYYWRITDPKKALYEVDILPKALLELVLGALRAVVGANELDAVLSQRTQINEAVVSQLIDAGLKWGVRFIRVEIEELKTDDKTSKAMLQQLEAERSRRATVSKAEGEAIAEVKVAEAQRNAAILKAEGQAKALELITEAETQYLKSLSNLVGNQAADFLLAQKYLEGFDKISQNPADKVFLPNSFQGLFSLSVDSPASRNISDESSVNLNVSAKSGKDTTPPDSPKAGEEKSSS